MPRSSWKRVSIFETHADILRKREEVRITSAAHPNTLLTDEKTLSVFNVLKVTSECDRRRTFRIDTNHTPGISGLTRQPVQLQRPDMKAAAKAMMAALRCVVDVPPWAAA